SDENSSRGSRLLETHRNVDRVPRHKRGTCSLATDNDLSRVDADAQNELVAEQRAQTALHRKCRVQCALGVILERSGDTKDGHDRVPSKLLDRAAGGFDLAGHRLIELLQAE